jgi:branched-chain amino acid aminotransferase
VAEASGFVNINGAIGPIAEGRISVLDHGFLFGDSIYETMRTYNRRPFLFGRHFARLERSAKSVLMQLPWDASRTRDEVSRTIDATGNAAEQRIRITVTRGVGDISPDPDSCTPAVLIFSTPFTPPPADVYENGVSVVISSFYRSRQLGDAKTGNLLRSVLAIKEAKAAGAFEAITLTDDGKVSDGITCNIWFVQGRRLLTPSIDSGILEGITRGVVLDLAKRDGLAVVESILGVNEIERSDELFLTSSTREIVPIVRVGGRAVGNGRPGPVTRSLLEAFRKETQVLLNED